MKVSPQFKNTVIIPITIIIWVIVVVIIYNTALSLFWHKDHAWCLDPSVVGTLYGTPLSA